MQSSVTYVFSINVLTEWENYHLICALPFKKYIEAQLKCQNFMAEFVWKPIRGS